VGLEWDAEQLLADVNAGVDLAAMFKADEIAELLAGVKGGAEADAEPQIDQAEELNKKWQVKPGDLWKIGAHRLLCGDSTKAADVARVMGREKAEILFTDPPYGVDYDGGHFHSGDVNIKRARTKLGGDTSASLYREFLPVVLPAVDGPCYMWFASSRSFEVYGALHEAGAETHAMIIWNKTNAKYAAMNAQYKQRHEPCVYFKPKGSTLRWSGPTDECTVWDIPRDASNDLHPTQKPIALAKRAIANHSSEIVLDAFAGSGSTLVACENLGRKCRAVEISPAYCAVILERMAQAFPKLEITRDDAE
jgi:DNA modification methylase